ncbi:MAG: pyridoxal phosphate-dependent aminotransferase family protein [Syntrophobacteraceae bacterium]
MFEKRFKDKLLMQRQSGLYRNPPLIERREGKYVFVGGRKILNFSSNDYLGLSGSRELAERVAANFIKYGTSSSSSRLVTGNYSVISRAEKAYADHFGYADALFFPSGYQANLGVVSALFGRDDTVIFDKHVHASTVKGMELSKAEFLGFKHNSMSHLKKRLESRSEKQVCVLTEALFSMDGDFVDLEGIAELKKAHGFLTLVDEAHSFGALGDKGRGIARSVADIAVGTFGKAFGLFGAFALLPEGFKEYLFNFSSPLIYSTTLPEAHAASAQDLLEIISRSDARRDALRQNSLLMKEALRSEGFRVGGDAHVIAVEIGDEALSAAVSRNLSERGVFAFPARFPTVPLGRAILRVGMSALHTQEDIAIFVDALRGAHEKARSEIK